MHPTTHCTALISIPSSTAHLPHQLLLNLQYCTMYLYFTLPFLSTPLLPPPTSLSPLFPPLTPPSPPSCPNATAICPSMCWRERAEKNLRQTRFSLKPKRLWGRAARHFNVDFVIENQEEEEEELEQDGDGCSELRSHQQQHEQRIVEQWWTGTKYWRKTYLLPLPNCRLSTVWPGSIKKIYALIVLRNLVGWSLNFLPYQNT